MAGTVTKLEETFGTVKKITFAWTSDGSGNATKTTTKTFSGKIERLVTVPGVGGDQPDDNYNVTINDQDSTDVLMGAGATRDDTNTEQVLASSLGIVANDTLSLVIDSAGAAKKGTVYLYIR